MTKFFIIAGILLVCIGLFWHVLIKTPFLGRLPGDILIQKKNFTFYAPLATSLLVSIVVSLLLWIFSRH